MALQLTFSCDSDKTDNGPTLIHSTGVQHYKIPPDVIGILQRTLTNDLLSDHQDGVLCQDNPQRILDIFRQHGFTLQNETNDDQRALWTVVQGGHGEQPVPHPKADTEVDGSGGGGDDEDQGGGGGGDGGDDGENKEEEEEQEQEQEPEAEE